MRHVISVVAVVAIVGVTLGAGTASATTVVRPTKTETQAQTTATVLASKARLVSLRIEESSLLYSLTVKVNDPASYLKNHVNPVASFINHLAFRKRSFTVLDHGGRRAFFITLVVSPEGGSGLSRSNCDYRRELRARGVTSTRQPATPRRRDHRIRPAHELTHCPSKGARP